MGKFHGRILNRLGNLTAIVEPFEGNATKAKEISENVFANLSEVPYPEQIESVVIAVPTQYHYTVLEESLSTFPNLKAVLLEKPMALSVQEAQEVVSKVKERGVKCLIGHIEVYNPVVTRFLQLIEDKTYGEIRSFHVQRKGAVATKRLGSLAGVLEDLGVHDFDIISRLISSPVKVYCAGIEREGSLNSVEIVFSSGKNIFGTLNLSREFAGRERKIVIEMEKATLFVDLVSQTIEVRGLGQVEGNSTSVIVPHGPGSSIKVYGEPLLEEHFNLNSILDENGIPLVSEDNGVITLKFVEACKKSIQTGLPVFVEW